MTLSIHAPDLAAALKSAAAIVETKNMLPILAMAKLEASANVMTITTTNLDVEYRQSVQCNGELPAICVDAKVLRDMASKAKNDMKLAIDGARLVIKSGRSRWVAPILPVDDFPIMPVDSLGKPMPFNPANIVKRLLWAADTGPSRPYLSGVYLNNNGGKAHFVSSNGYVMPMIQSADRWPAKAPNVILAAGFLKALPDIDGKIEWDDTKARFTAGDIVVTGKTIEGSFPEYGRIVPEPCEPYAVDAMELKDAIESVRLASQAQQRKLRIKRQGGSLAIRIEGTSGFEGEAEIEADCTDGFEMGVNADYLVGMLAALDAEAVAIEQSAPNATIAIRPTVQDAGQSIMGLVWPLRI